jgi:hypothetical protein
MPMPGSPVDVSMESIYNPTMMNGATLVKVELKPFKREGKKAKCGRC